VSARLVQPISTATIATSIAYGSPITKGSLLVLAVMSSSATTGATDTKNNIWQTAVQSHVESSSNAAVYYAVSNGGGANTVTPANVGSGFLLALWEVACTAKPPMGFRAAVDKTTQNAAASGSTADPGAITPSYVTSFLVAAVNAGLTVSGGAAGWTFTGTSTAGVQTLIPAKVASQDGSFSISSSAYDVVCASFGFVDGAPLVLPKPRPFLV
jgi:hypothetical protein